MNIKSEILLRVRLAFVFIMFFALAVVGRIFYVQWGMGDFWKKQASEKTTKDRVIKATRGNIYALNGELLATSIPRYKIAFDPTIVPDKIFRDSVKYLAEKLAKHFGDKTAEEYRQKIRDARAENKEYIFLNNSLITYNDKRKMLKWPIFNRGRYKGGVLFERIDQRYMPFKYLARRSIGFVNQDNGGAGLEYSFNSQLGGKDGRALFQRIANGIWKPVYNGEDIKPDPGMDIYTTIDINLQDVAETSLLSALKEHDAHYGCVIVMEVNTGEIKVMANLGRVEEGDYRETYNYAIAPQGVTEPGSTFKLASLMALLEEVNIELTDSVKTGNGVFKYTSDAEMRDSKLGGHGTVTIQNAFELSSNIAFVKLISSYFGAKPERFISYLKSFGLADPLGFQMAGTAPPNIKTPKDKTWSGISLPWMAVGYESQMSPLQMLTFYNAVANNGKMLQPIIVKEVRVADEVIQSYNTTVLREKICSDKTLSKVKQCLIGVVERGTASNIKNGNYKIAGKTGTSQKFKNGRYTQSYYTSFVGFFPAEKPKYTCIVVIDEPKGIHQHGSDVAAPVFKDIADKVYALDVEMHKLLVKNSDRNYSFPLIKSGKAEDLQYLFTEMRVPFKSQQAEEWVMAGVDQNKVQWKNRTASINKMPDVKGMTLRDALFLLENKGLEIKIKGKGRVTYQSSEPGSGIIRGSEVLLELD